MDICLLLLAESVSSNLEAKFFHFISDDKLKDTQFVISAKYELYMNHLPERIQKVQYRSDGATNLCATIHYLIQPLWEIWTGIVEEICKHCPTGDGKSELDGNFGIVSHRLHSQHNLGFSFNDMVEGLSLRMSTAQSKLHDVTCYILTSLPSPRAPFLVRA